MNYLLCVLIFSITMTGEVIYDFDKSSIIQNWRIVDDVVMGGRSSGTFNITNEGHGLFQGNVSLENNGGFSSVRYRFEKIELDNQSVIRIRAKGDGKKYQFRIKDKFRNYYSYITYFQTTGDWQDIEIRLQDMYPTFRGYRLNMSNFSEPQIEELAFLIANKKAESFQLMIDRISIVSNP